MGYMWMPDVSKHSSKSPEMHSSTTLHQRFYFLTHVKSNRRFHVRDWSGCLARCEVCICVRTCLIVHSMMQKAGFSKCPHVLHLIDMNVNWVAQEHIDKLLVHQNTSRMGLRWWSRWRWWCSWWLWTPCTGRYDFSFIKLGLVNFSPLNVHHPSASCDYLKQNRRR